MSGHSRRGLFTAAARAARAAAQARDDAAPLEPEPAPAPAPVFTDAELERYSRQLVLPEWSEAAQARLRRSAVLVVGAGALGSPVAMYLAGAGVGRLGILDGDDVELSNLHRQLLHFTPDVGTSKAHSAAAKLGFLNPDVLIDPYQVELDPDNAAGLVAGFDLVVDCSDSSATRYAVNGACCDGRIDLVEAGVTGFQGLVMAIRPDVTPCYRCAFPQPPPADQAATCAQTGVLGPAAGVIGSLQALEALKLLSGLHPLEGGFLQLDLLDPELVRVSVTRRPGCADCGS